MGSVQVVQWHVVLCSRFGLLAAHLIGLGLQLLFDDLLVNIVCIRVTTILHVLVLNKEDRVGEGVV